MLAALHPAVPCHTRGRHPLGFHDAGPAELAKPPRLLDRVRAAAHLRHHSRRTEAAYVASLFFLYCDVPEFELPWLDGVVQAKRPERLPVVLTREEVAAAGLRRLGGTPRLMGCLENCEDIRMIQKLLGQTT